MKTFLFLAGLAGLLSTAATAESIGVSMAQLDDHFLNELRHGLEDYAATLDGVDLHIEDATHDVGRQISQVQNFILAGDDAIIVNLVDPASAQAMTDLAEAAGIPLVFLNRVPVNLASLPSDEVVVTADEHESGVLQTQEICRLLRDRGLAEASVAIIEGDLANEMAVHRTEDIHEVLATPECAFMHVVEERTGHWRRQEGADLMTNWLAIGDHFDAVISNNDEMALGAIASMKAAGLSMEEVIVAGIDATEDGLAALQAGDLDLTVFQDVPGQAQGAVDAALGLARGEEVAQVQYTHFALVTPDNLAEYLATH